MAQKDVTQENMTQLNAAEHSAAYTAQDRWLKMPMAEYIVSYRDSARVRGYCRECGRYGNCWACPPYDFDETALLEQYTTISIHHHLTAGHRDNSFGRSHAHPGDS